MTTSKERILPKHRPHLPNSIKIFGEEINWYMWLWMFISNHSKHSTKVFLLNIWLRNSNEMIPFKNLLVGRWGWGRGREGTHSGPGISSAHL